MAIYPPIQVATIGMGDSILLMVLALVVFGPRRLPQIGRQIGKLMYEFRKASNDFKFQMEEELRNSEEAERRKRDETERQRALAEAQSAAAQARTAAAQAMNAAAQAQSAAQSVADSQPAGAGSFDADRSNGDDGGNGAVPDASPAEAAEIRAGYAEAAGIYASAPPEPNLPSAPNAPSGPDAPTGSDARLTATGPRLQPPSTGERVQADRPARALPAMAAAEPKAAPRPASVPALETASAKVTAEVADRGTDRGTDQGTDDGAVAAAQPGEPARDGEPTAHHG